MYVIAESSAENIESAVKHGGRRVCGQNATPNSEQGCSSVLSKVICGLPQAAVKTSDLAGQQQHSKDRTQH